MARRLVTLTTDVGSLYAAQMKAVLYRSLRPGEVVDLSHDLPRHGIREAAFLLRQIAAGFPAGTVHVAVIDPGVGGRRAPLAIQCADGSCLVGPDTGVLAPLAERLGPSHAYRLDPARVTAEGRPPSATFEGRDLFAPAAARIARGTPPAALGEPTTYLRLALPAARRGRSRLAGEVVHVDRFGNLITNVPADWLPRTFTGLTVRFHRRPWRSVGRVRTYEEISTRDRPAVLGSSFGTLEVSVREGSAAERLNVAVGEPVELRWRRPTEPRKDGK